MKIKAEMQIVDRDQLFAVGNVILDDLFVIHQVKILKKDNDLDVFLPRKKGSDGWKNIIHITDKELLSEIKEEVKRAAMAAVKAQPMYLKENQVKISVRPYNKGDLRGYAKISCNDVYEIDGIQIREKMGELYVVYPYVLQDSKIQSLISPRNIFIREDIQRRILQEYQDMASREKTSDMERGEKHERSK